MKTNLLQAYKQAPWRVQLQWIGIFLLVLVSVGAVAGVYLSISGRAAATGRRIQVLENEISRLQLEINDLSTQLATISSARSMYERLDNLDMVELEPLQALYLEVQGYQPRGSVVLAPPPNVESISSPTLLPEFTSSLWDWLRNKIWDAPKEITQPTEALP